MAAVRSSPPREYPSHPMFPHRGNVSQARGYAYDVSASTSPGSTPLSSTVATSAGSSFGSSHASEVSSGQIRRPSAERALQPLNGLPRESRRQRNDGSNTRANSRRHRPPQDNPSRHLQASGASRALSLERGQARDPSHAQGVSNRDVCYPPLPPGAAPAKATSRARVLSARAGSVTLDDLIGTERLPASAR
mmetsp:Transcript_5858/g.7870  ORF Transcript_5858/g.7870 Transcript_5858/m.7870 type:complete len:192 (+) Transcript_5858:293-868(+)